jgi:hypothetical protein
MGVNMKEEVELEEVELEEVEFEEVEFEEVEVTLDAETKIELVTLFVLTQLDKASQLVYKDLVKSGEYIEDALCKAVLNNMITKALDDEIAKRNETTISYTGEDNNGC